MVELIAIATIIAGAGYAVSRRVARTVRGFADSRGAGCSGCGGRCGSEQTSQAPQLVQLGRKC